MRRSQHAGRSTGIGLGIKPLSESDIDEIHYGSLEVLERTGVFVEDNDALDILGDHGCRVDRDRHVAHIPAYVVMEALAACPPTFCYCGRDPENDFLIGSDRVGFMNGCVAVFMNDLETGENRPSTKQDIADIAVLVDYLRGIDVFVWPVDPRDTNAEARAVHACEAAVTHTTKHVHLPVATLREAEAVIEMATFLAGGLDELQRRPIMIEKFVDGVKVDDGTLALDENHAVDPFGDFLSTDFTYAHMRDLSAPRLLDRHVRSQWQDEGASDMSARAKAKAKEILADHTPEPLPDDVVRELSAIVARAESK